MAKKGNTYFTDKDFTDAEVIADPRFSFPCSLILRNGNLIVKETIYDLNGNKSVVHYSAPETKLLTLGSITATTTTIDLAVHSSGVNSVQIDGEVLAKSTPDHWEFAEVTAEEVFIIYATNSTEIFQLAENGMEIPAYALIVATITISETGTSIDEAVSGFREKAIDKWANLMTSGGDMVLSLHHNQMRYRVSSSANDVRIGGFKNYVTDLLYSGIPLSIKNNTEGDIEFFNAVDASPLFIPIYSADLPFKIKKGETANFAWNTDNGFEIVKTGGGGGAELPPGTNGQIYVIDNYLPEKIKPSDRLTNVENEIDAETVNRALADTNLQGQVTAEKNRNDAQDVAINNKVDKPTTDGIWSLQKIGSVFTWVSGVIQNIANTDLSNISARTFTQGNTFTWNTAGFFHYLKGLLDKTGDAAYTKVVVVHPTTGEMVTRDFADPQATTLAVQNASTSQKTAMRTALLGTATPANPTISHAFPSFVKKEVEVVVDLNGLNLTLLEPVSIWIEYGSTKIFATNFMNISTTLVRTTWLIPSSIPNGDYLIKIQNGVAVQGLSTGSITVLDSYNTIDIPATSWKNILKTVDDNGNPYTINNQRLANNIQLLNYIKMQMPLNHEDKGDEDLTGGNLFITNKIINKDKDYEILIDISFSIGNTGVGDYVRNWFLGLTNTDSATLSEIGNVVKSTRINASGRSFFNLVTPPYMIGNVNLLQLIKTGNKVVAKYFDYTGAILKTELWTLSDMTSDFGIYVRDPRSRTVYINQVRELIFTIKEKP